MISILSENNLTFQEQYLLRFATRLKSFIIEEEKFSEEGIKVNFLALTP